MLPRIPMQYPTSVLLPGNAHKDAHKGITKVRMYQGTPHTSFPVLLPCKRFPENTKTSGSRLWDEIDGEVSLKSKSTLSTASVQTLLTAGFEI